MVRQVKGSVTRCEVLENKPPVETPFGKRNAIIELISTEVIFSSSRTACVAPQC